MKVNRQQTLRNFYKPLLSGHFKEGPEGVRLIEVSLVRKCGRCFVEETDCEQRKSSLKNSTD